MSRTKPMRYTVYDNRTDFPVIVSGTARECAKAMDISISTFWNLLSTKRGAKWVIMKEDNHGKE